MTTSKSILESRIDAELGVRGPDGWVYDENLSVPNWRHPSTRTEPWYGVLDRPRGGKVRWTLCPTQHLGDDPDDDHYCRGGPDVSGTAACSLDAMTKATQRGAVLTPPIADPLATLTSLYGPKCPDSDPWHVGGHCWDNDTGELCRIQHSPARLFPLHRTK